jgi:hypothetical protein
MITWMQQSMIGDQLAEFQVLPLLAVLEYFDPPVISEGRAIMMGQVRQIVFDRHSSHIKPLAHQALVSQSKPH